MLGITSRDMLTCTVFEDFMTQFTPLSAAKKRPSAVFPEAIRCRDLPGEWRLPLQGIECGAGTESDDATATVGTSSFTPHTRVTVTVFSYPRIIDPFTTSLITSILILCRRSPQSRFVFTAESSPMKNGEKKTVSKICPPSS